MGRDLEGEGEGDGDGEPSSTAIPSNDASPPSREQFRRYRKKTTAVNSSSPPPAARSPSFRDRFTTVASPPSVVREPWLETRMSEGFQTPIASGRRGRSNVRQSLGQEEVPAWGLSQEEGGDEAMEAMPSVSTRASMVLRTVKPEPGLGEEKEDSAEESYGRFASMMNFALQEQISLPVFMEECEGACHDLSQTVREEAAELHRVTEERLMRQTAQMLQAESGTWSLIWHLFGKRTEEMYSDEATVSPPTSAQEAAQFILTDSVAQQCLRIVQWLESIASKKLDYKKTNKGWYAGSYMQKLGVWHQTQRAIRKRAGQATLVHHVDPDAPTREHARLHAEDQKLEEDLLEDVWKLLRAGRLGEAQELCRSAGQPWRAASLGGCGELGPSPSIETFRNAGANRGLQALELESGIGQQRRLWKWTCFCASEKIGESVGEGKHEAAVYAAQCGNAKRMLPVCFDWESACWALARSWLNTQVDSELLQRHPSRRRKQNLKGTGWGASRAGEGDLTMEVLEGSHSWPQPVLDQQPRDLVGMFQKLHSGDLVNDNVQRSCKEQQRQVQMDLMVGDFSHLLDLLKDWTIPRDSTIKPHGHPQNVRFAAHLVLVLRRILANTADDIVKEKLGLIGDLILSAYVIFLFTEHREEFVGVYASQLAPHLCVELYVNFMDLRQNDVVPIKYKIFRSAIEFLPFFQDDDNSKGCVSDILHKLLSKSRDIKPGMQKPVKEEADGHGTGELRQLQSLQKAQAVQWLCFTPPSTIPDAQQLRIELLARALEHSNLLFREFALISLWRTVLVPAGPHKILGHLAEPLKHPTDNVLSLDHSELVLENIHEFEDWRHYYECDALYRSWLKVEQSNAEVPAEQLSVEEKERAIAAAREALDQASALLHHNGGSWLSNIDTTATSNLEQGEVGWIQLQATAVLMSASGAYLAPEPTVCTTLISALHHCGGEAGALRQLTVDVDINRRDANCVDVRFRCKPVKGDGIGSALGHDGGLLGSILALAAKGELPHFQTGLALEVVKMDASHLDYSCVQQSAATYILRGLCRRCCLPELLLRCMQLRVFLAAFRGLDEDDDEESDLIGLVASTETALHHLFSQRQLQEFLLLERDVTICSMESSRDNTSVLLQ